jgi:MoaA/NifB/PqqE/SkfB family radical SAM enzyme
MLIHVGPQGTIDPCPFVPFSPFDAGRHTLRDALGSAFFRELRRRSRDWDRRGSGCAYRLAEREFLEVAGGYGVGVRPPIGVVTPLSRAKAIASS